jgi:hypothetical protein
MGLRIQEIMLSFVGNVCQESDAKNICLVRLYHIFYNGKHLMSEHNNPRRHKNPLKHLGLLNEHDKIDYIVID